MKFRNEMDGLSKEGDLLHKDVGNATVKMQMAFEYSIKHKDELKEKKFVLEELK